MQPVRIGIGVIFTYDEHEQLGSEPAGFLVGHCRPVDRHLPDPQGIIQLCNSLSFLRTRTSAGRSGEFFGSSRSASSSNDVARSSDSRRAAA